MIEVVCGIIFHEGEVFICRRKEGKHLAGFWEFPGGKIEQGESFEEALIRELHEELSMAVEIHRYLGFSDFQYDDKQIRLHAIECKLLSYHGKLIDHDSYTWLMPKDLKKAKLAPADIPLVDFIT